MGSKRGGDNANEQNSSKKKRILQTAKKIISLATGSDDSQLPQGSSTTDTLPIRVVEAGGSAGQEAHVQTSIMSSGPIRPDPIPPNPNSISNLNGLPNVPISHHQQFCGGVASTAVVDTVSVRIPPLWEEKIKELPRKKQEQFRKVLEQIVSTYNSVGPTVGNGQAPPNQTCDVPALAQRLIQVAQQKRQEWDQRKWKICIGGKQIVLRAVMEKIIDFANRFREIGNIIIQYDPTHAALPWAGFVLILQFATSESNLMGQILIGLEEIARLTVDAAFYEKLYLSDGRTFSTLDRLRESLAKMYYYIVSYMVTTIRISVKNRMGKLWNSMKYDRILTSKLDDVREAGNRLRVVVGQVEAEVGDSVNKELKDQLSRIHDRHFYRFDEKINQMVEHVDDQKRSKILKWLSVVDYTNHHKRAREGLATGTGEWLLKNEDFIRWQESSGPTCLWLKGNAGTGKTKLASIIIETLTQERQTSGNNSEAFAYFYCNRDEPERRNPDFIMSTLLKQLASLRPGGPLQKVIIDEYEARKKNTGQPSQLLLEDGYELAKSLCDTYLQSLIIIDALDECDQENRENLLEALHNLATESSSLVKIFVTSRLDEDIATIFNPKGIPTIELESCGERTDDIKRIIDAKVQDAVRQLRVKCKLGPNQVVELGLKMREILVRRAEGMPLWITHQINNILKIQSSRRTLQTMQQILDALESFPSGLSNTYDYMLIDMFQNPRHESNAAGILAFKWVIAAVRPLSPDELLGAIDPDEHFQLEHILDICNNLLVHDKAQGVIRFYHLSVREYLETHQPSHEFSNVDSIREMLIETPLELLTKVDDWDRISLCFTSTSTFSINMRCQAFLQYITGYWPKHLPQHSQSKGLWKLLTTERAYEAWVLALFDGVQSPIDIGTLWEYGWKLDDVEIQAMRCSGKVANTG